MIIQDVSKGYSAGVNDDNQLQTHAVTMTELEQAVQNGDAYVWCFTGYDYDAADTVMHIKNTDTVRELVLCQINLYCDTASKVQVHKPSGTTIAGTSITGVNMNVSSSNTALATTTQDETGNTQGTVLINKYVAANGTIDLIDEGQIVLGYGKELGVDIVTAGTMAYGQIIGFYRS